MTESLKHIGPYVLCVCDNDDSFIYVSLNSAITDQTAAMSMYSFEVQSANPAVRGIYEAQTLNKQMFGLTRI